MRDISDDIGLTQAIAPAVQAATVTSAAVDTLGFNSLAFLVNTGAIVGSGDFSASLLESDSSGSGFAAVDASQVKSNAPASLTANGAFKLGYFGDKRYVQVVLTKNGGTSLAAGAVAVQGHAASRPVA